MMKIKTIAITAAVLMAFSVRPAIAEESVGYNRIVVPASTDVRLTVPFNQDPVGTFTVNTVTGTGVSVTGPLVDNAFNGTHYVRFITGNGSGLWSTISDNGVGIIDFVDEDVLPFLTAGDTFRIYKHDTLGGLFPKRMSGKSHVNGTQVLIYENNIDAMTINKSASKVGVYNGATGNWAGAGVNNGTILRPETQFILRNNSAQPLTMITHGDVPDYSTAVLIAPSGDLVIGSGYPLPVVLKNAGLNGNLRQVLFYNNSAPGFNKSASKIALYNGGTSTWVGAGVTGNELITPSEVITLRLPSAEAGTKVTIKKPY